jgi:hypothetical protein
MKQLWHGKLKAWFDRHPFAYDWAKKSSYAALGLVGSAAVAYWQRVRLEPLWATLQEQRWMPAWAYLVFAVVVSASISAAVIVLRKLRKPPEPRQATDQERWAERAAPYAMEPTAGGAVVRKFTGRPEHYAVSTSASPFGEVQPGVDGMIAR